MTEKEKIVKIICNMDSTTDTLDAITRGDVKQIADALIAAGIGDVSEYKHRAEVAERALREFSAIVGCRSSFQALIFIPKDTPDVTVNKGIFIFQTIATYGIKTITVNKLSAFLSKIGLTLEVRTVSPAAFAEKLLEQGKLYSIKLIRNTISPNHADNMLISTGKEERVFQKPILRTEWKTKFINYMKGIRDNDIFEINNEPFENISVTFQLGKERRTLTLLNKDRFGIVEEIPPEIFCNGKGDKDELVQHMIKTACEYKDKMVFVVEEVLCEE